MPFQTLDYDQWLKKYNIQESNDYDTKDAWFAGVTPDSRGHLDDVYKNPNHITYSEDSLSSKRPGAPPPGRWDGSDKDGWTFYASPTNIQNAGGTAQLQDYFKRVEPQSKLVLPPPPTMSQALLPQPQGTN